MPILGIGNKAFRFSGCSGYTLLEVLAVITILGIVLAVLAAPDFMLGDEKATIQSIGKLITSDLNLARNEANLYHAEIVVNIQTNGYVFTVGEMVINRHFNRSHFRFQISDNATSENLVPDGTNISRSITPPTVIDMTPNGLSSDYALDWKTDHFKGSLRIARDGAVEWKYERI